jgi:hypothetical protein
MPAQPAAKQEPARVAEPSENPMTVRTTVAAAALAIATTAQADMNADLNRILEDNASSAAYARVCDEEPMSEQLKANTMMLLAATGMEPHNVQLGSAKFNDVMRREIVSLRGSKKVDCSARVQEARDRLAVTQGIIRDSRRDRASDN